MKDNTINFWQSARIIGAILTFVCLMVSTITWGIDHELIDLTQIIMMILQTSLTLLASGIGAAHMGRAMNMAAGAVPPAPVVAPASAPAPAPAPAADPAERDTK